MPTTAEEIRAAVEQRFAQVARSPEQERKFPVGPASAKNLGYDPQEIDALPPSVTESFCGVGNPLGPGQVHAGQTVLDLGCGAGLGSWLAAPMRQLRLGVVEACVKASRVAWARSPSSWRTQAPAPDGRQTRYRSRRGNRPPPGSASPGLRAPAACEGPPGGCRRSRVTQPPHRDGRPFHPTLRQGWHEATPPRFRTEGSSAPFAGWRASPA